MPVPYHLTLSPEQLQELRTRRNHICANTPPRSSTRIGAPMTGKDSARACKPGSLPPSSRPRRCCAALHHTGLLLADPVPRKR